MIRSRMIRSRMKRISGCLGLSTLPIVLVVCKGCNALNPLWGSARTAPIIGSLSASTITFAQVQQGFVLTVNGSQFVSSSVVVINGTTESTSITSSTQLKITITTALISTPGTANVAVNTPNRKPGTLAHTSSVS